VVLLAPMTLLMAMKMADHEEELHELSMMMVKLLETVLAIDQRVCAVEETPDRGLLLIDDEDEALLTSTLSDATLSWKWWNQKMVGATPLAPGRRVQENAVHLALEPRWVVVGLHDLPKYRGGVSEDVIVFLDEMEEVASQGGWSDNELVWRTANQLEGEAEALRQWVCMGLWAGIPLWWTML